MRNGQLDRSLQRNGSDEIESNGQRESFLGIPRRDVLPRGDDSARNAIIENQEEEEKEPQQQEQRQDEQRVQQQDSEEEVVDEHESDHEPAINQNECIICLVDDVVTEYVFVPCGHGDICRKCGNQQKVCPICRRPVKQLIRIYTQKRETEKVVVAPIAAPVEAEPVREDQVKFDFSQNREFKDFQFDF